MAQTNVQVFSGNVGIGTTNPATKFHVETPLGTSTNLVRIGSSLNSGSSQSVSGIEFAGNPAFFNDDNYQRVPAQITSGFYEGGTADWGDAYISLRTPHDPASGTLNDSLTIRGGNVGIGTNGPAYPLHVMSDTVPQVWIEGATNSDTVIQSGSGPSYRNTYHRIRFKHYALPGDAFKPQNSINFEVNPGAATPVSAMTINGFGRVGIGTTTPGAPLSVVSTRNADTWAPDKSQLDVLHHNGVGTTYGMSFAVSLTHGDGIIQTFNRNTGTAQYDLRLQPNAGNVGIGTTNPTGKLHIYEPTGTSHGIGVGSLILDHGNSNGSSSIVFVSRGNFTSDYAYITYNENYGEAGVQSTENGVLLLGSENDGTGSSDHVRVKSRLVVEATLTTTQPTYAFQVKSSNTTSDLFNVHRGGSIGINGNDQNVPFTINTNKYITVNGSNYNSFCRMFRGSGNWYMGSDFTTGYNQNLYWFANLKASGNPLRLVITFENDESKGTLINANSFTGQHRNIVRGVNPTTVGTYTGLIVSADNNENIKVNGGVERGLKAITINETIPYVSVTTKAYDKQVFGVVSGSEDPDSRQDTYGRVTSSFTKEEGDDRIFINSLGEGAMWISNQNGPLTSGDYVTSSHIPGYGMKQDSEFLANYTVAKITMDCDFLITPRIKYKIKTEFKTVDYYRFDTDLLTEKKYNLLDDETKQKYTLEQYEENVNILDEHGQLQWEDSGETEDPYQVRYLLPDGTQISEEEYTTRALADEKVYIAAFVGCTYHCG
jgi:hypothetical protein